MAKQDIDIGIEGNDGTGDSIRESFRKVNDNFAELYAIFGLGGDISFTSLNDTPETYLGNEGKVTLVRQDGTGIDFYDLVSDAGTNDPGDPDNTVSFEVVGNTLVVKAINAKLNTDSAPTTSSPLKISASAAYNQSTQALILGGSSGLATLVSTWNSTHGSPNITADNLLVSKGYTDQNYVNVTGDTLTGALSVPAGATGSQVPRVSEVVSITGDTMTGELTLSDHPYPFAGAGTPNSQYDLQAATKFYVDSSSYSSTVNLFVTQAGDDAQALTPPGKAGRSESYSYASIAAACAKAERIQQAAPIDVGPYIQTITYQDTGNTLNSYLLATGGGNAFGYPVIAANQTTVSNTIIAERQTVIDDTIAAIASTYPDFIYNETLCRRDLGLILDSIRLDIKASTLTVKHNALSRYAGLRYYTNPSSEIAISANGQYTETTYGITQAKIAMLAAIETALGTTSDQWYTAVSNRFDDILQIIDSNTGDPALVEAPNYYNLFLFSGPDKFADQSGNPNVDVPNIDLIPGKVIRGKTTGAIGRIVTYARGADTVGTPTYDTAEIELLAPIEFETGEEFEFGNLVKETQVTIKVESGIYEEQLPIRLPENTSIKGDEIRRTIIRPAAGVSTSPYASTYFYRDAEVDGIVTATGGDLVASANDSSTIGYYGYHYLTDPSDPNSTPKNNNQMDVFLTNDSNIIRSLTVQRHGGFMVVLDPTGSIQTRSPYVQTCSSFSASTNEKRFAGGMYIDGFTYNMPVTIVNKDDNFTVLVEAPSTSGLGIRKPNTPSSFFINGIRYQVNAIKDYIPDNAGTASATLILDPSSNDGIGLGDEVDSALGIIDVALQGAGNKSMLANDYTQINDLGYGIFANNNALAEIVSVFTYYCHIGYYSRNGSEIRSLTGNNSYGTFGMVSEGSDPDETSRDATLAQNLVQPAKIYSVKVELTIPGDVSGSLTIGETVSQDQGTSIVTGTLSYFNVDGGDTILYVENVLSGTFNIIDDVFESSSTILGAPSSITNRGFTAEAEDVAVYVYDLTDYPLNSSEIEILHDSGLYQPYEVVSVSDTGLEIPAGLVATLCDSGSAIQAKIWRFDLSAGIATSDTGIQEDTTFGTLAVYRAKQNLLFNGINSDLYSRPSTAIVFDEFDTYTYRTLAFENTIVGGVPVVGNQARVTIDDNYAYLDLLVINERAGYTVGGASYITGVSVGAAPAGGTGLGRTQGDLNIAISALDTSDKNRVVGKIFTWAGKVHRITGYTDVVDDSGTIGLDGSAFGIVTFEDVYNINPAYGGTGLATRVDSTVGNNISIKAGLESGEIAAVTINISTCRATAHDFLDIGTGGYNTTNYPGRIYGAPTVGAVTAEDAVDTQGFNSKAQVQEKTKGRVFFASTDQDGFFRVGRFFTVDQGTGRVTFNAALVLTNIDGIGFKRGVRVNEFSPDTTFTNATGDAVPTETAVEGYINRRLGWDRDGDAVLVADIIGGGAIRKAGDTMTGSLSLGGNQITNLGTPTSGSDAATKNYVDGVLQTQDELSELQDVNFTALTDGDLLIYDLGGTNWINAATAVASDIALSVVGGEINANINPGVILNADVSASAAIAQSKLAMSAATTRANATAIVQSDLGLASFNSSLFTSTNGWINITDSAITNSKLQNSGLTFGNGTTSSSRTLGTSVTIAGTTNQITVGYSTGTFTLSLPATINANTTGNAATASVATQVSLTDRSTTNSLHYPLFSSSLSGTHTLYTDSNYNFNPGTNTLSLTGTGGLSFTFNAETGSILPRVNTPTDSGQSIGSSANRWNTVFATTFNGVATEALYADLAENYLADAEYEPGTVLVFGGAAEVTQTTKTADRRVAGVVTTNPAHLMNSELKGDYVTGVALQGRVPCKVLGRVEKGDLLVTSAIPGYAVVNNDPRVGTVIGKAVAEKLDTGYGVTEVVVGRV